MSEVADRERVLKRNWAAPGGVHDRVIQVMKLLLPAAIGVVLALVACIAYAIYLLAKRPMPGAVSRAVGVLIAGISLVDAALLASVGAVLPALIASVGFVATLMLQEYIAGT